jgi:hypothetical protein
MSAGTATAVEGRLAPVGQRFVALVRAEPPDARTIAAFLDALSDTERVDAIRALGGARLQSRLWDAVAGQPRVTLDDLVAPDEPPLREVVFEGKNSLVAFTTFQKRFCRPPGRGGELWGYNHQPLAWLTGPGYFVVHDDPAGAALDYRAVPADRPPPGWPAVAPNGRGVARVVYGGMVDHLRRVARDVFIGSAFRGGKPRGNWFLLCRGPG